MSAYRTPADPPEAKVHSWTTVHGRCPSCGSHPLRSAHTAQAQTAERVLVTCDARAGDAGCGAQWVAESFAAHQAKPIRWSGAYGPPLAWAVVFAFGVMAGVGTTLVAVHP